MEGTAPLHMNKRDLFPKRGDLAQQNIVKKILCCHYHLRHLRLYHIISLNRTIMNVFPYQASSTIHYPKVSTVSIVPPKKQSRRHIFKKDRNYMRFENEKSQRLFIKMYDTPFPNILIIKHLSQQKLTGPFKYAFAGFLCIHM